MLYLISNSNYLTSNILNEFKFTESDIIVIFNLKPAILRILRHLKEEYKVMPELYWIQRETITERPFTYRASSSDLVRNKWFSKFFLFGGAQILKIAELRKSNYIDYNKDIEKESFNDFLRYKSFLLSFDASREVIHVDIKSQTKPFGLGYKLFGIKRYEPYTGLLSILYLDKLYPNLKKVMIGFNSYQDEKYVVRQQELATHRNLLDYNMLVSYCLDKGIEFRYSKVSDSTLIDDPDLIHKSILFKTNGYFDITDTQNNNIIKCPNFEEITNRLIDSEYY